MNQLKEHLFPLVEYTISTGILPMVESPLFQRETGLQHGFSTRKGGVSKEHLASLNLSFSVEDAKENVLENFRRIGERFGKTPEDFVLSKQSHETKVLKVGTKDRGKGITKDRDYEGIDALITDEEGIILSCFSADCVPILFYDPIHKAVGACHSGWRGTKGKILQNVVEEMRKHFSSNPAEVLIAIGPSICKEQYVVSEDLALSFLEDYPDLGEDTASPIQRISKDKFQLDLWDLNRRIALDSGIKEEHISISGYCTMENPELFFSHRYSQGRRGLQGAFICLQD
ncbi:peptidoglycan editing factor PgeF [Oribacterium sinus]|uniref:Purine nucleoside phosphorylase n=1 Tax=Oribacterium sinus TaxID=237576 RepID=A0A930DN74_9FIRM|nr:peptidoglycan editing factor PgeF [Oribacterium sinus]MBF1272950.1 peptidoglycan editing factor PgeF [Oribacterium sinus]